MKAIMNDRFREFLKDPEKKKKLVLNALGAKGYEKVTINGCTIIASPPKKSVDKEI